MDTNMIEQIEDRLSQSKFNFLQPQGENVTFQKREEFAVSLRKQKQQSILREKRRKIMVSLENPVQDEDYYDSHAIYNGYPKWIKSKYLPQIEIIDNIQKFDGTSNFEQIKFWANFIVQGNTINFKENYQLLAILTQIRKLVSTEENPDIFKLLLETQIMKVTDLAFYYSKNFGSEGRYLKLEATWILTNLAAGKSKKDNYQVVDYFIFKQELNVVENVKVNLEGNDVQILDQIFFFLANVLESASPQITQTIINDLKLIDKIKDIIEKMQKVVIPSNIYTNLLVIFCQLTNAAKIQYLSDQHISIIITFLIVIFEAKQELPYELNVIILKLLANVSGYSGLYTYTKFVDFAIGSIKEPEIQADALKIVGSYAFHQIKGNSTYLVENLQIFDKVNLDHEQDSQALNSQLWIIQNILQSSDKTERKNSIQKFIESENCSKIIYMGALHQNQSVKKEALYVITNAIIGGSKSQRKQLHDQSDYNQLITGLVEGIQKSTDQILIQRIGKALQKLMPLIEKREKDVTQIDKSQFTI